MPTILEQADAECYNIRHDVLKRFQNEAQAMVRQKKLLMCRSVILPEDDAKDIVIVRAQLFVFRLIYYRSEQLEKTSKHC